MSGWAKPWGRWLRWLAQLRASSSGIRYRQLLTRLGGSRIELQYGKARRIWVMDRGVPTEEVLEEMRSCDPPVQYLVGTPKCRLQALAPGLTPRSVLDKFAAVQMIDVHIPTTDGRELILERYTEPERDLKLLLRTQARSPRTTAPKITGSALMASAAV